MIQRTSPKEREIEKKTKNFTTQKLIDKQKTDLCADRELLLRSKLARQDVLGLKKKERQTKLLIVSLLIYFRK